MQVIVKARHTTLTPSMRSYAESKLGESLRRVFDRPAAKIEIELCDLGKTKDGGNMECRVIVFMPKNTTVNISEISDDMYKAIDLVHDRLLHQVKRQRRKRIDSYRDRKAAARQRADTARTSLTAEQEQWEEEFNEFERSGAGGI